MAAGGGGGAGGGVFNIYSCNTQGAGNVGYVIGEIRRSDIVMLQESGRPGFASQLGAVDGRGIQEGQVNFGTNRRPDNFHVVHYPNGRCSLTVLVRAILAPAVVEGV